MSPTRSGDQLRLALPKGHMQTGVFRLLADAGIELDTSGRNYRPPISLPNTTVKLLKPQNIVEMLHVGSRDLGFAGHDWVVELKADVVELLDTGLDPVQLVAAAPQALLLDGQLPAGPLVVASEYETISRQWIEGRGLNASFLRSFGATEVFPPEDADVIVDNTATGATLRHNQLAIVGELLTSSTRLYANKRALENPALTERIDQFVMLLQSVLEARLRVMLEVNCPGDRLEELTGFLPCMREPTISKLHGEDWYSVRTAVLRKELPKLIPQIKAHGGRDIVVTAPDHLIS
jgi:ATP phosphoribosyltransferase